MCVIEQREHTLYYWCESDMCMQDNISGMHVFIVCDALDVDYHFYLGVFVYSVSCVV